MATAPEFDWSMHRNDDKVLTITVKDSAGLVVDLTGTTEITFKMSKAKDTGFSTTVALTKKLSVGVSEVEITDAPNGVVQIKIDSDDTESLKPTEYYYEVEVIDSLGKVGTVLIGTLTILKDLVLNP